MVLPQEYVSEHYANEWSKNSTAEQQQLEATTARTTINSTVKSQQREKKENLNKSTKWNLCQGL